MEWKRNLIFLVSLQNPKWNPTTLEEVNMGEVESVFEPLGAEAELSV
jgi:3-hydroxyisobutyryl-CoA hydrolase